MVVETEKAKNNSVEIEAYLKPSWVLASTNSPSLLYVDLSPKEIFLFHILNSFLFLNSLLSFLNWVNAFIILIAYQQSDKWGFKTLDNLSGLQ